MPKHLSKEILMEIQTRYELGDSISQISRDYKITDAAIHHHIKTKGWSQKLRAQVTEIQQIITDIKNESKFEQYPIINDKLKEMLQVHEMVNNFVKGTVDLNLRNLRVVAAMPDSQIQERVKLTSQMKATMPDVAAIAMNRPTLQAPEDADKKENSAVQFYLPDNER